MSRKNRNGRERPQRRERPEEDRDQGMDFSDLEQATDEELRQAGFLVDAAPGDPRRDADEPTGK